MTIVQHCIGICIFISFFQQWFSKNDCCVILYSVLCVFFLCFFFLPASCGKFRGKLFSFSSVAKVFQSDVLWKRFLLHKQRKLWRFIDLCHERKSVKLPKNINIFLFFAIIFLSFFQSSSDTRNRGTTVSLRRILLAGKDQETLRTTPGVRK